MSVAVSTAPTFSASQPWVLFEGRYEFDRRRKGGYDVAPDAQQFLMITWTKPEPVQTEEMSLVLNWFEELKRRVPSEKNR